MTFSIQERGDFVRWLAPGALLLPFFLLWVISIAPAAEPVWLITWKNLLPQVEIYNDPFLELTPEQKLDLVVVTRTRQLLSGGVDISPEQTERFTKSLNRLEKDHIDIDGLLALREAIVAKRKRVAIFAKAEKERPSSIQQQKLRDHYCLRRPRFVLVASSRPNKGIET